MKYILTFLNFKIMQFSYGVYSTIDMMIDEEQSRDV